MAAPSTDATCYMFNQLEPSAREQLFHELFHPSEMGLTKHGTRLPRIERLFDQGYSYDDGEADPELTRFSIDHDREYVLPKLRQARQVNPTCFFSRLPGARPDG